MKLLFVAHYFPLRSSSVFRVYDFARFLISLGNNVSVISRISLHDILRIKSIEDIDSVRVYRALCLDFRLSEVILDIFQIVSTFMTSFVAIVVGGFDIVIISVPPGVPGIGAFLAGKISRKKIVFDVRDKWEDHSINLSRYRLARYTHLVLKKLFDVFYSKADLVIGVTSSLVEYLKARGVSKVALVPNGADVRLFYPREPHENNALRFELGLHKEDIVLVYAGGMGIGGYYRPDIVIQALGNLGNDLASKLKFLVIGGSEEPLAIERMLELTRNLGLQKNVIFLGEQKRESVARILSCCDIGVVPYDDNALWDYAQPAKFFDYCASGLPIIATVRERSELGSLIARFSVGYRAEPLDASSFASAVRRLCDLSQKERKDMGERARSLVVNSFDRFKTAERLMETLKQV